MKYHRHRSAYPYVSGMRNKSIDTGEKNDKLLSDQLLEYGKNPERISKTAQNLRNQQIGEIHSSSLELSQKKTDEDISITKNFSNEELESEKIQKLEKLGLEDFMKELITNNQTSSKDYSDEIIQALNKTYIKRPKLSSPHPSLSGRLMKRSNQILKSPKVQWNPQKKSIPAEFKQMNHYIPTSMFPSRKKQTNKLKSSSFSLYRQKSTKSTGRVSVNPSQNQLEEMKKKIVQKTRNMFSRDQSREKKTSRSRQSFRSDKRIMNSHPRTENVLYGTKISIY